MTGEKCLAYLSTSTPFIDLDKSNLTWTKCVSNTFVHVTTRRAVTFASTEVSDTETGETLSSSSSARDIIKEKTEKDVNIMQGQALVVGSSNMESGAAV